MCLSGICVYAVPQINPKMLFLAWQLTFSDTVKENLFWRHNYAQNLIQPENGAEKLH